MKPINAGPSTPPLASLHASYAAIDHLTLFGLRQATDRNAAPLMVGRAPPNGLYSYRVILIGYLLIYGKRM
ncbi:MAG: hypothetical protein AB2598_07935 [Candidatus Thiodiazotropha sp.]